MRVILALLLLAHPALAQDDQRRDRSGVIEEFGWTGRAVRTRDRDVQFELRREAQVTVVQLYDDGSLVLVGTGRFEAGRHVMPTPVGAATDASGTQRVPFAVSCRAPCDPMAGRTPPSTTPTVRVVQTYLVMATDSAFDAAEIESRLAGVTYAEREVAVRELPRLLFAGRTPGWAAVVVRR